MESSLRIRLGVMMLLEYFIWGAWYVTFGTWLGAGLHFTGQEIGLAAGATAVGALIAPFFVGLITDRMFATERVLAALHCMGAIALWLLARQTNFFSVYAVSLIYCVLFMPTIALTNSLAFRQMQDPKTEFGPIRVMGTFGWIMAGLLVGYLRLEASSRAEQIAAACSLLMSLYCLTLPHTPPLAKERNAFVSKLFPSQALAFLRVRPMAIFAAASFLICIPLQFYYAFTNLFLNETGVVNAAGKMTGGQMSELICMLLIPWFFRRLGVKYMLAAGMGAWVLRYLMFSFANTGPQMWMFWVGILLHGICYDFFFVTGQIYIDREAPLPFRAAAQGIITFITYGAGMLVGSWLSGAVVQHYTNQEVSFPLHQWRAIWLVACACSTAVLVTFLFVFSEQTPRNLATVRTGQS